MEHNSRNHIKCALTHAATITLSVALLCLLLTTFLLCSNLVEQLLPLILLPIFLLIAFFGMRMRWAKAHVWLFYTLCGVFAIACGFAIRAVF
jgi:hypothetical protein